MMSEGTITWDAFLEGIQLFCRAEPNWEFVENGEIPGSKYLTTKCNAVYQDSAKHLHELPVIIHQEYNIMYSLTHQVPLLYFNLHFLDGKLLTLDQVLANFHIRANRNFNGESIITQGDHPILNVPYFILHACNTSNMMKQMTNSVKLPINQNLAYISGWLSLVESRLGFHITSKTTV